VQPTFSNDELARFYPSAYYAFQPKIVETRRSGRQWLKDLLRLEWTTRDPQFAVPGAILDVGCGSGWFLERMARAGWRVSGVEPSPSAAETGRSRGIPIATGTLRTAALPAAAFDYVRANHSFEHVPDPNETVAEMFRVLRPGGKLLLGVPNIDGWVARLFRQYWWHLAPPVHVFQYSAATLPRMLEKHGFRVQRVQYNSDGVSIFGSLKIYAHRRRERWSTSLSGERLTESRLLVVVCHFIAKLLDVVRAGDAIEVIAVKP
jgi:SAM-dependent methyltransferase